MRDQAGAPGMVWAGEGGVLDRGSEDEVAGWL